MLNDCKKPNQAILETIQPAVAYFSKVKNGLAESMREENSPAEQKLALSGIIRANLVINQLANRKVHIEHLLKGDNHVRTDS